MTSRRPALKPISTTLTVFLLLIACIINPVMAGPTLEAVKSRGHLRCGVNAGLPGFSSPDQKGNWKGMDVDVCRAVAAAVLARLRGRTSRRKFVARVSMLLNSTLHRLELRIGSSVIASMGHGTRSGMLRLIGLPRVRAWPLRLLRPKL